MTVVNNLHRKILETLVNVAWENPHRKKPPEGYFGNTHQIHGLSVPEKRALAKKWLKENSKVGPDDFFDLLDSLYRGESNEEKTLGGTLLEYAPALRRQIELTRFEKWLDSLEGWQEVDSTCQSAFPAKEILSDWTGWRKLLTRLGESANINKRRASLVLLVRSTRDVADERLGTFALNQVRRLMHEKEILISKAVSWLLRSMSENYAGEVKSFLAENLDKLQKNVIREVEKKLLTGKKSG